MCVIFLFGCDYGKRAESLESEIVESQLEDESGDNDNINQEEGMDIDYNNILSVAERFSIDILEEAFESLLNFYPYSEEMRETMSLKETHKNIAFHNVNIGNLENIEDAYSIAYGANTYAIVPIQGSLSDVNLQITFDKDKNIVGFSYEEYDENSFTEEKEIPEGIIEEDFSFNSEGYVIPGTLTTPAGGQTYPLVILVHGWGSIDRDGSIFQNKPFRDIAWGLAERGIASYRYDKRTYLYKEEIENNKELTVYNETIYDAVAAANTARELKNVDPDRVYILGHSHGGYLLPRIAEEYEAAGYILMSSPAQHMKHYLKDQYEYLAMEDQQISHEEHTVINQIISQLNLLERPSRIPEEEKIRGFYKNYWIDLNQYNPISIAGKIEEPVLVLQGERDYQVTMKQYNLWRSTYEDSANWNFLSYPSLNHFMMEGEGNSYSAEYREKHYVNDQVIQDIADFILGN